MTGLTRFLNSALVALTALAACSPTLNWREVRPDGTPLAFLMPCKPDKGQKTVPMAGQPTELMLLSCDAGGSTFAVAVADVKDASKIAVALAQWQSVALANIKAGVAPPAVLLKLPGLASGAALIKATGQRPNGQAVSMHAAYFAQGAKVFQVAMYADNISADAADTFFSGLKFE